MRPEVRSLLVHSPLVIFIYLLTFYSSPYVFNTVGRDNYKYFCGILVLHPVCFILFVISSSYFIRRVRVSIVFVVFLLYCSLMAFLIMGLFSYHFKLISHNLTTNEDVNMGRYSYMRNEYNSFHNPFDKGGMMKNIFDGLFPSSKLYYTRAAVLNDRFKDSYKDNEDPDLEESIQEGFFN
jgi:hypothetical protein